MEISKTRLMKAVFLGGLLVFALTNFVVAAESTTTVDPFKSKCTIIKSKLERKHTYFKDKKTKYESVFVSAVSKIEILEKKLLEAGYDTSSLDGLMVKFKAKTKEFSGDYEKFLKKIENLKNSTCTYDTEDDFRDDLDDVKDELSDIQKESDGIRNFYTKDIKEEISKIKEQKPTPENGQ